MTVTAEPWSSSAPDAAGRKLVQLPTPAIDALSNGDLESARNLSAYPLPPYLIGPDCSDVWKMRSEQIKVDPRDALWVTRLVIDSEGVVVGRAGFHGQPDREGVVEVGYAIDPLHRRQGHARAAFGILLDVARKDPQVKVVRASVSPDNVASRKVVDHHGLREVGDRWDEDDGFVHTLEVSVS
ncbi:uncharacterized protein DNG_09973 [Cephalotrichum gorgonifer]|uniref:N-acetyltransferase domain-containing protein n=1 Tax=Cephalotrichum gorgonifer TaxID=2041049 RepID=A0AAE8N834_9PEZI|nr:uncharacterized protein DNG_09973 [Cephalotrichum gorgonifer]